MILPILSALLVSAAPEPCAVPESMPPLSESMAGEGDPDWCLEGADIFTIAGPDLRPLRQLVWEDKATDFISITQWRRDGPDAPPAGWRKVFTRPAGAINQGQFYEILIQKLANNLIVVTANPAWRIGNAVCAGEGGMSIGYLPAGISPTETDRYAIEGMSEGRNRMDPGYVMCTLLEPDGDGWRASFRGPQGRPLPEIDDFYQGIWLLVTPAGDLEQHLRINR